MKVDLKDFTTVDSIGEIDDEDLDESADDLNISELDNESLGLKFVKKVEALYCETCENYLSHDFNNEEEIIMKHCRTKIHLKLTRKVTANDLEETGDELNNSNQFEESHVKEEFDDNNPLVDVKNETCEDDQMEIEKSIAENNEEEDEDDDETILNIDILR